MIKHGNPPYLECSGKGDKCFSALHAKVERDGMKYSIEELYQGFKVFQDGVTNLPWRRAKGRRALNQENANRFYSSLWDEYIRQNPHLLTVLRNASGLSDMFGQEGHCCQATELWRIRNDKERFP